MMLCPICKSKMVETTINHNTIFSCNNDHDTAIMTDEEDYEYYVGNTSYHVDEIYQFYQDLICLCESYKIFNETNVCPFTKIKKCNSCDDCVLWSDKKGECIVKFVKETFDHV